MSGNGASRSRDYYRYRLAGVVVHMGTAHSGHYYSYIKERGGRRRYAYLHEQSSMEEEASDQKQHPRPIRREKAHVDVGMITRWFEFNDTIVTEFDPKDLEAECFGGEEITHGTTASLKGHQHHPRRVYLVSSLGCEVVVLQATGTPTSAARRPAMPSCWCTTASTSTSRTSRLAYT